jgi:esterase/lipase superfamily enzyme
MSTLRRLDLAGVRSKVERALAEEDRTGALRALLLARRGDGGAADPDSVDRAVERAKRCVTLAADRLEAVEAAPAPADERRRIVRVLEALLAYWGLEGDLVPDAQPGIFGLIDDALLTHMVLDQLRPWYVAVTGAALVPEGPPWPDGDELRALLAPEVDRALSAVADAIWAGAADATLLARFRLAPFLEATRAPVVEVLPPEGPTYRDLGVAAPTSNVRQLESGARLYDVWFATNRAPLVAGAPDKGFGGALAPDGAIHYGTCSVQIPKTHQFGSVGRSWWQRWRRLEFADDHITVRSRRPFADADAFFQDLRDELGSLAVGANQVLFYLHGYNTSFDNAAIRAAQLFADLKAVGAAAFFSWPSKASLDDYFADADRIAASEAAIASFLARLAADLDGATVHIIAHSMGNRGLARAIQRITAAASGQAGVRFGQIILAAPDIEATLFKDLARVYADVSRRTTMYVSARDRALGLSRWLQDSACAGFTPPVTVVPGVDTIEVTNIDVTTLGHGYYAEAEAVLYDIADLLRHGDPPERRPRIHPGGAAHAGPRYWVIGA